MWGSKEVIRGARTSSSPHKPFTENDADRVSNTNVWIGEAKRVVNLLYNSDVKVKDISCRRYTLNPTALQSQTNNPNNAKYYMNLPDGLVPVERVSNFASLVLSYPHFMSAALNTSRVAATLSPNLALHNTFLDVEVISGLTFNAHKRLMGSIYLKASQISSANSKRLLRDGAELYIPLFWGDEYATINDKDADNFKEQIYGSREMARNAFLAMVIIGSLLIATSIGVFIACCFVKDEVTPSNAVQYDKELSAPSQANA